MENLKTIMERFKAKMESFEPDDMVSKVAIKIARLGFNVDEMDDESLRGLMSSVYEKYFDEEDEGWVPYDHDVEQVRGELTFPEDEDEY